jgi:archaemetzincin
MSANIHLVPIGIVPTELTSWVAHKTSDILGHDVVTGDQVPLPTDAYNPRRRQMLAAAIMDVLSTIPHRPAERVLGLTDADCYTPGLNFIFGQAALGGNEALVALPRLRQSFYGLPEDPALFRVRVLKEAIHELGHTWGLSHCAATYCVMRFSNTLRDTDVKGIGFCLRCQARLG